MQQRKAKKIAVSLILTLAMLVSAQAAEISSLIPIGHTVGIQMSAEGVLVVRLDDVQTADGAVCPARDAGVLEGENLSGAFHFVCLKDNQFAGAWSEWME